MKEKMECLAIRLNGEGYVLRSGKAKGSDKAFEKGADANKEIFTSKDVEDWALAYVKEYCIPTDRSGFDNWKPYIKGLLGRNMMQVLGKNGNQPVNFIVCFAPSLDYTDSSAGGTGYALRCAEKNNIPIYNMFDEKIDKIVDQFLEQDEIEFEDWMRQCL